MNARTTAIFFAASALLACGVTLCAQDAEQPLGIPLVKIDSDYTALLNEARKAAQREDYADAVELYQGLIERGGDVVFETSRGCYLPIAEGARRAIAELPQKGLNFYLSLYEPVAQRAVNEAVERGDLAALLRAASQYPITAAAARALYLAGVFYFDQGEHALAARYWRKALASARGEQVDAVTTRARLAAALAKLGRCDELEALAQQAAVLHPNGALSIGGRQRLLSEFIREQLTACAGVEREAADAPTEWRMQGGNPSGTKLMADSDFALNPQWSVSFKDTSYNAQQVAQYRQNLGIDPNLELIPYPIVVGDRVLVHSWDWLHSVNAYTGALVPAVPHEARLDVPPNPQAQLYDTNRWAISSDGARVFSLEKFPPLNPHAGWRGAAGGAPPVRSNFLVARDINSFKIIWRIGGPDERDEWLRTAVFVTAPTPSEGQLFLLAEAYQSLYLVCLDAETGSLRWKSFVSSLPPRAVTGAMYGYFTPLPGSSPAVYGESVVCITNGGVLASFDRSTGNVRWAVQYPSTFNQTAGNNPFTGRSAMVNPARFPPNPLIIYNDTVYAMPADSDVVAAYDLDSGKRLWSVERGNAQYLAGISADRLILAGGDATCLSARDGKTLWRTRELSFGAQGRPALSEKYLYLCQKGEGIVRIDLKDGSSTLLRLGAPNAPLGTLVLLKDKLIVTTPTAVAAYISYDAAYANASKIINQAASEPANIPQLYRQRALVSLNCLRYERAIEDFRKAAELARAQQQTELLRECLWQLCQAHVQWAVKLPLDQAAEQIANAAAVARDPAFADSDFGLRARSEAAFAAAALHEASGNYTQAVGALQEVLDSIAEVTLDAPNYRAEDGRILTDLTRASSRNTDYARQEIGRLVKTHGAAVYAAQDAAARKLRARAAAANNVPELVEVARRYPFSPAADGALQDAAEFLFRQQKFKETEEILLLWRARHQPSNMPAQLLAALALTYENQKRDLLARRYLARLNKLPHDRKIEFAHFRGTIESFLQSAAARLSIDLTRLKATWTDLPGDIRPPLTRTSSLQRFNAGGMRQLLVDAEGSAVTHNDNILMLEPPPNAQIAALNPRTLEPQWKALADFNPAVFAVARQWPPQQLLARLYEQTLVVADRDKIVGINAQSGKRQWIVPVQRPAPSASTVFGAAHVFSTDPTGKITAVDPSSGKRLWEFPARSPSVLLQLEPGTEYIAVVGHSQMAVNYINQSGGAFAHARILNVQAQPRADVGANTTIVTCLSATTGKITAEFKIDSNQDVQFQMTDNDQLLAHGANFVRSYAPDTGKILWEASFRDANPRLLTVSEEFAIYALDSPSKQDVVALDLETGKIRWRRSLEDKRAPVLAISAVVQRDQVVIAGALQAANLNPRGGVIRLRRVVNQQGYQVIGPRIAAFGLADGKARFLSKLFANDDDVNWQWLLGPVVTENQVITVVKQQLGAQRLLACITDANSGALLQELAVDQPAANQPAAANPAIVVGGGLALRLGAAGGNPQGFMSAGNAAVANGVLIIEGSAEIIVFDKSDTK